MAEIRHEPHGRYAGRQRRPQRRNFGSFESNNEDFASGRSKRQSIAVGSVFPRVSATTLLSLEAAPVCPANLFSSFPKAPIASSRHPRSRSKSRQTVLPLRAGDWPAQKSPMRLCRFDEAFTSSCRLAATKSNRSSGSTLHAAIAAAASAATKTMQSSPTRPVKERRGAA